MRRAILTVGATLAVAAPAPAAAAGTGGVQAPDGTGGSTYGQILRGVANRPVATVLRAPTSIVAGATPKIRLRIDHRKDKHVRARLVILRTPGGDPMARIDVGKIRTGRTITVRWPKKVVLAPGQYLVRVHAKDARNHVLERKARAAGRTTMTVTAPPAPPAPETTPAAPADPAAATPMGDVVPGGVFPVRGAYTWGDGVGEQRTGHTHQGQDLMTAEGTPIVAPTDGTITVTSYQAGGAGYYVVEQSADGRSFFFAHCQKDSTAVKPGQVVAAGTPVCGAGATGDASGPHLHFEIWVGGWRSSAQSHFVDPLAQLRAWEGH